MDPYEAQAKLAQYRSGGGGNNQSPWKFWIMLMYIVVPMALAIGVAVMFFF